MDGAWRATGSKLFRSPRKSGGGGMKFTGGGGGAAEGGGGGTKIFSSMWPGTDTTDPVEEGSPAPVKDKK